MERKSGTAIFRACRLMWREIFTKEIDDMRDETKNASVQAIRRPMALPE